MKSKEEIQQMLSDALLDYDYLQDWLSKAMAKYQEDKKYWGHEADLGEVQTVNGLIGERKTEIQVLEWVLRDNEEDEEDIIRSF
jgi:hypothetical protein